MAVRRDGAAARAALRAAAFVLFAGLAWAVPAPAAAQGSAKPRLALVIGEGGYAEGRLPTAIEDAGLMASAFAQAGFAVTALADADAATIRATVAAFAAKARDVPGATIAVYVSGRGLQYGGENWLAPVGTRIDRTDAVPGAALKLAEVTAPLQALPASLRIFLFDLSPPVPSAGAAFAPGLALVDAPAGSVYAYSDAPGAVAPPAVPPYGPYARALAEAMQVPGLPVEALLRRVRLRVGERTDGAAAPFDDGTADPGFSFLPGPPAPPAPLPDLAGLPVETAYSVTVARDTLPGYVAFVAAHPRDALTGRVRAMVAVRREALFWSEAVRAGTPRAYWTYQRRYPRGPHFGDARRMLFAAHAALEPPPRFDIVGFEGLPPPAVEEPALLDRPAPNFADADGPSIPAAPASMVPPARAAFYEALPPPPIALAGALPLPLPPPSPGPAPGLVEEPSSPGGPLATSYAGNALATARSGLLVSRVADVSKDRQRVVLQTSAEGKVISRTLVAPGADGGLVVSRNGPGDRILGRATSRDGSGGLRETILAGPDGRTFATTTVAADGIVKASALVPGVALPPRFVLAPAPDAKGEPVVAPEPVAPAPVAAPAQEPPAAPPPPEAAARPPLPPAPGLTGEAPRLDLPPAPKAAAFDSAAAPVAAEAPAPAAAAAPNAVAPNAAAQSAQPASSAPAVAPAPPPAAPSSLPAEPPLPPRRAAPAARPKHR